MAKVTITFEDIEDTGEVKLECDFDPPITQDSPASHSVSMAVHVLRYLRDTYKKEDEDE